MFIKNIFCLLLILALSQYGVAEDTAMTEAQIMAEEIKVWVNQIENQLEAGTFDIKEYVKISNEEISKNIQKLLKEYDKVIIDSLQLECVPVGIITSYTHLKREIIIESLDDPRIWERFKDTNPYDMVLEYDGKPWISADDFKKAGVEAYKINPNNTIKVKIIKSSLDKIIETEFRVYDDIFSLRLSNNPKDLQYGIYIYGGFLVTGKTAEIDENSMITPGTFIRPVKVNEDKDYQGCSRIIDLNLSTSDLHMLIEDSYKNENKIYLKAFDPVNIHVKKMVSYYDMKEYDFIVNYYLNNNINPVNIMECYETMAETENAEWTRIFCELYKWLYLSSDKFLNDILLIKGDMKEE